MSLGDTLTHLTLLNTMAEAQGLDLADARSQGVMSNADFSDMLTRCRGCNDAGACAETLAQGAIPQGCANDARWDALRKLTTM